MLNIRDTKVFHGPSLWAPVPAIVLEVAIGELEARLQLETPIFFDRLITLVPSLSDEGEVVSQPEGGLRRLLLDRLALALQNQAGTQVAQRDLTGGVQLDCEHTLLLGSEVTYAVTHPTDEYGVYQVVYAYEHEELGIAA